MLVDPELVGEAKNDPEDCQNRRVGQAYLHRQVLQELADQKRDEKKENAQLS